MNGGIAGFTTFYTSTPGQIDMERFWDLYPRYLGINAFPDEDSIRTRKVTYKIKINNPLSKPGDIVSVRLLRKDAQFQFTPQKDLDTEDQIFHTHDLNSPAVNQIITGTFTLQRNITDAVINVRFKQDYPVLGEENNGVVTFESLTFNIS